MAGEREGASGEPVEASKTPLHALEFPEVCVGLAEKIQVKKKNVDFALGDVIQKLH